MNDIETQLKKKQEEIREAREMSVFWDREVVKLLQEEAALIEALPKPTHRDHMQDYLEMVKREHERKLQAAKQGNPIISPLDQARKSARRQPRSLL
jgi:hypothetical protein